MRPPARTIRFGAVTLIPDERLLLKDGQPVSLTPKAFDLLAALAASAGRLVSKDQLLQAVWPDTAVEESNLSYHVFAIRKALGEAPDGEKYIETVPRKGYRFVAPLAIEPAAAVPVPAAPRERRSMVVVSAVLALVAVAYLGFARDRNPRVEPSATYFQDAVAGRLAESAMFAVSPDGRRLVFAAEGADGVMRLWLRTMSELKPVPMQGTEVFTIVPPMIWSPDSRFIAYEATGILKKAAVDGGTPQTICQLPGTAVGGSWNVRGDILVGNAFGGLVWCHAGGGNAVIVSTVNAAEQEIHLVPSFLSDGRHFIYLRISRTKPATSGVYLGELVPPDDGAPARVAMAPRENPLIATGFGATLVPGQNGEPSLIVFARDGALFAQPFDEGRLALGGEPMRLADHIGSYLDTAFFSASPSTLVYRAPEPDFRLTWFDRRGAELGRVGTPARFTGLALSANGDRALVPTHAPEGTVNQDLWLFDLARSAAPQRMTFEPTIERSPLWTNDNEFAFGSQGGSSGIYRQSVGGGPHLVFKSGAPEVPSSAAFGGRALIYTALRDAPSGADIWMRTELGPSPRMQPLIEREGAQTQAQLSPDHRWLAYVSNEAGPNEVFVAEFQLNPASGSATVANSIRLSESGGFAPQWRADGRELLYLKPDGAVMSIAVDATHQILANSATRLFAVPDVIPEWGVTPDGRRFLFAVPVAPQAPYNIVQGWRGNVRGTQ
ncbi:MAG: winged helix-turn-helix domain-containing protein [Vicinamibacterales bacterium]